MKERERAQFEIGLVVAVSVLVSAANGWTVVHYCAARVRGRVCSAFSSLARANGSFWGEKNTARVESILRIFSVATRWSGFRGR